MESFDYILVAWASTMSAGLFGLLIALIRRRGNNNPIASPSFVSQRDCQATHKGIGEDLTQIRIALARVQTEVHDIGQRLDRAKIGEVT